MSKVEIVGPKQLLQGVLALVRSLGLFQIEPSTVGFVEKGQEEDLRSYALEEKTVFERLFLEDLRDKVQKLFSYLPNLPVRKSYLDPQPIIGTIVYTVEKHIASCRELTEQKQALERELSELRRYSGFLDTLESLFRDSKTAPNLDVIGLTIKDAGSIEQVRMLLSKLTGGKFKLFTVPAGDGTLGGLITVEKAVSEKVSKALSSEHIPEMSLPESFDLLSLPGKIDYLDKRTAEITISIESIDQNIEKITKRWRPIYVSLLEWIEERLSLLTASASAFETKMCFFINGWMPTSDTGILKKHLAACYANQIVVEEKEMREEDLEHVPVMLKNPPYFKPFELFTRILRLPTYTSLDPTPFIGIFFPVFFGMILGDAGYGIILLILSVILKKRFSKKAMIRDASQILFVSSIYSIFFGTLYGEFFGDLPHRLFGLSPICIERRTAIIPMIYFTLSIGVGHVILGLFLGIITAYKKKTKKEAFYKIISILIIVCLIIVLATFFDIFPEIVARPVILAILFLMPFLLFTGGLLAPLELLKSIGNIISYVRIMAIGLTSVLLAFMANNIAGLMGNVVIGIVIAVMLHLLNIVLGVFSPTIHSLRLHYVEFFSKFLEQGGREFEPLKKNKSGTP
jgi:V/A-type H+-transporting ATPase subunit I